MPKFLIHQNDLECDCEETYPDVGVYMSDYCLKVLTRECRLHNVLRQAVSKAYRCGDCCDVRTTADNVGYSIIIFLNIKYDPANSRSSRYIIRCKEGV